MSPACSGVNSCETNGGSPVRDLAQSVEVLRFGPFEVDLRSQELRRRGIRIRLRGQSFDVLATLLSRPGELVTREELQGKLWPSESFGDFEHGLNAAVNRLREALSDSADQRKLASVDFAVTAWDKELKLAGQAVDTMEMTLRLSAYQQVMQMQI